MYSLYWGWVYVRHLINNKANKSLHPTANRARLRSVTRERPFLISQRLPWRRLSFTFCQKYELFSNAKKRGQAEKWCMRSKKTSLFLIIAIGVIPRIVD